MSKTQNERAFDLTSQPGMEAALEFITKGDGYLLLALPILGPILGPIPFLAKKAVDYFSSRVPTNKQQEEIVINIIRTGRAEGLSEIEIILESDIGADLAAKLPKDLNVDFKVKAGATTKTTIRAKYRDA